LISMALAASSSSLKRFSPPELQTRTPHNAFCNTPL
jgi:hypothetical protein